MGNLIAWAVLGLLAGAIARAIYPGKQSINWIVTMLLGLAGSLVGGTIFKLATGGAASSFLGGLAVAVLGAVLLIFVYYKLAGRSQA